MYALALGINITKKITLVLLKLVAHPCEAASVYNSIYITALVRTHTGFTHSLT